MKNLGTIMKGLLGLTSILLIISCEKEPMNEEGKIYEENLIVQDVDDANGAQETPCGSKLDLALVIDESGSMDVTRLTAAKNGAKSLIDELNSTTLSTLVSYNYEADRPFDLRAMDETGQNDLMAAIDQLGSPFATNIQSAIIYASEELTGNEDLFTFLNTSPSGNDRDDAQKVMIILSDGDPNHYYNQFGTLVADYFTPAPATAASEAAEMAKAQGIRIISIAVADANETLMRSLASSEDDFYFTDDAGLESLFDEIAGTICTSLIVALDIHPTSCPNPLPIRAKGLLPVSINGSDDFDVTEIDVSTVTLETISPVHSSIEDVSTPFDVSLEEPLDPYSCTTLAGDGYYDLTLKFDYDEVRSVLGNIEQGDVLSLEIKGKLNDGTDFTGEDIVIVK